MFATRGYLGEHEAYRVKRLFREELHRQDDVHRADSCRVRSPTSRKARRHSSVVRRYSKSSRSRSLKPHESFDFSITPSTSSSTDASDDSAPGRFSLKRLKRAGSLTFDDKKIRLSHQNSLILLLGVVLFISMGIIFRSDRTMNDEFLQQYERTIRHHQRHHKGPMAAGLRGELVKMAGGRESLNVSRKKAKKSATTRRVFFFAKKPTPASSRTLREYPADLTDNTQFYGVYDSNDERLSHMEIRQPLDDGECVPMKDWQTTYHPSCNMMHELGMEHMGESKTPDFSLFGTKGYWRNAWRVNGGLKGLETIVLKTLKFQHNFEDAHFEHDRVDAVAMERLTSSPHVINIFDFCGHSVMTEFADGSRLGELADKNKKNPLARLRIARDIADGLADVHGIDGDGLATFVHLDINPANVVSVGGTLKLNDFNIGILRRWNTTSNTHCGFPAQYPNPQWRSPEEARNEQDLTEKVDVFSMGHIFFRLICGHEPWNKLEIGGKPSKENINAKVQKGVLPRIPEEIMSTTDPEVAAIRDVMLDCYAFDPAARPSARSIATRLQEVLKMLEGSGSGQGRT
ncbi:protein tyrosine kinase [Fragilaria crotonensis]|nr:protein tyrosine kinase [Fragilaria crotonensis]